MKTKKKLKTLELQQETIYDSFKEYERMKNQAEANEALRIRYFSMLNRYSLYARKQRKETIH